MNMSLSQIIQLGRRYLKRWPERGELSQYFREYHQIVVARFVCKNAIHFAGLIVVLPIAFGNFGMLPQAVVSAAFIFSMPIQAYIMLGLQADKFLPPGLASWYKEGVAKYNQQGGEIKLSTAKPKYFDLVELLNVTYSK